MKSILALTLAAFAFTTSGCFVYERRTVPTRVVVRETLDAATADLLRRLGQTQG